MIGETIPIRLFLGGFELTPTFREVNKKFSVRYYLNLVLIDEENRRYFKQQVSPLRMLFLGGAHRLWCRRSLFSVFQRCVPFLYPISFRMCSQDLRAELMSLMAGCCTNYTYCLFRNSYSLFARLRASAAGQTQSYLLNP